MKNIITILVLLIGLSNYSSAQGNLQFNQVVAGAISYVNLPYNSTVIGTITVPAGKVWKIESTNYTYTDTGDTWPIGNDAYPVMIDSHMAYVNDPNSPQHYLPLWLPAGTYNVIAIAWNVDVTFSYSAIEFNVVP